MSGEVPKSRAKYLGFAWLALFVLCPPLPARIADAQSHPNTRERIPVATKPTFRTSANLVLLDIVVRDRNSGKPIEGLQSSGFHVFEDGREQRLSIFQENATNEIVRTGSTDHDLPPGLFSNAPEYSIGSAANVVLLDLLNTRIADQAYARAQLRKFLRAIPSGTLVSVFALGSELQMVQGFTTNTAATDKALSDAHPSSPTLQSDLETGVPVSDLSSYTALEGKAFAWNSIANFGADARGWMARQRSETTLAALAQLGRYLSTIPGRKNLIWVSGGFPVVVGPPIQAARETDLELRLREVDALLARARVAVYPVDARGLMTLPNADPANDPAGGQAFSLQGAAEQGFQNSAVLPQEWAYEHMLMQRMARDTGGQAWYDTNAVAVAAAKSIELGSSYYTLGYVPEDRHHKADWHRIEVRIDRPNSDLSYRRGYYAVDLRRLATGPGELSPMAAAMLHGTVPLSQVLFKVRVTPAAGSSKHQDLNRSRLFKGPSKYYAVDYSIALSGLALSSIPGGGAQAEIEIAQAVYDSQGRRVNFSDAGLEVNLTRQEAAEAAYAGIPIHQEIDLPADLAFLRMGVRDANNGAIGTLEIALTAKRKMN